MKRSRILPLLLCLLLLTSGCAAGGGKAAAPEGTELEIYCFQAGKADAFLLTTGSSAVLIDTGETKLGSELLSHLAEAGIDRLDCLLITHFDKDHVGGAAAVLAGIPVDRVLQSNCPKDSDEYAAYTAALAEAGLSPVTVTETYAFTLDGVCYTVDPPRKDDYEDSDSNNSSLIVTVENGKNRLLFSGDAETERLAEFIAYSGRSCDFLKVPYHGHAQEGLAELIASVKPAVAVITSSEKEPEDEETLELLEEAGAEVYLTRVAPVRIVSDGETITAEYAE